MCFTLFDQVLFSCFHLVKRGDSGMYVPRGLISDLGSVDGVSSKDSSTVSRYSAMSVALKFDLVLPEVKSECHMPKSEKLLKNIIRLQNLPNSR